MKNIKQIYILIFIFTSSLVYSAQTDSLNSAQDEYINEEEGTKKDSIFLNSKSFYSLYFGSGVYTNSLQNSSSHVKLSLIYNAGIEIPLTKNNYRSLILNGSILSTGMKAISVSINTSFNQTNRTFFSFIIGAGFYFGDNTYDNPVNNFYGNNFALIFPMGFSFTYMLSEHFHLSLLGKVHFLLPIDPSISLNFKFIL